jgi:peptide/nickel transport system substrate-binding protein
MKLLQLQSGRLFTIVISGFVAAAITGCNKSSTKAVSGPTDALATVEARKDTLIVARESEPEWLNPVAGHQHADSDTAIFRGLFKLNEKNELINDMAQSWTVSKDGMEYIIRLRPGILWHDSTPFTAEDVKFTVEVIQDDHNHSGLRKEVEDIKSVTVVDPLTVRIALSQPLSPLLDRLKIGMLPKHALDGKDFNTDAFNHTKPVGTGPYRFRERKSGEYLMLEANPDFYDGPPKIKRIIYKFIPDPNVRLVQLKKGEVDVAALTPKQIAAIKADDPIRVEVTPSADYRVMMFNLRDKLFKDVRVRQAIQFATDRDALVKGALLGYGAPGYGPLQFNRVTAPAMLKHDNDVSRAEALLKDAGWTRDTSGMMQKDGKRLSFVLTSPASDPVRGDLATLLALQLARAGIEAKVEIKDWAVIKIPETQALILGGGLPSDPDDDLYRFLSSRLLDEGSNYSGFTDPVIDKLLEKGRHTMDETQRVAVYRTLQTELTKNPPYNYLVYLQHLYGVRKDVSGFQPRVFGHGTSPLWNIEQWRIESKR